MKDVNKLSEFCEEHSHATEHFLYGNPQKFDRIVLIDDEFTTGNTALNFILELKKNLGVKEYTLLSILDWRNEESIEKLKNFEIENKVIIQCASILKGIIEIDGDINSISNIYNNKKLKDYKKCNSRILNIILNDNLKSNIFNIKDNRYVNYLKYIFSLVPENNYIALDFFAGSGSSLQAICELNIDDGGTRKFMGIQIDEKCKSDSTAFDLGYKNIFEVTKKRIIKAGEKLKKENPDIIFGIFISNIDYIRFHHFLPKLFQFIFIRFYLFLVFFFFLTGFEIDNDEAVFGFY